MNKHGVENVRRRKGEALNIMSRQKKKNGEE